MTVGMILISIRFRAVTRVHEFMKIYVKCPKTALDWFIIELQGEVSVDGEDETFNVSGLKFGDITEVNVRITDYS